MPLGALIRKASKLDKVDTFADGAAGQIGQKTWEGLKDIGLANVVRIPEDRICLTMLDMLNVEGLFLNLQALAIDALKDLGALSLAVRVCASPAATLILNVCQRSRTHNVLLV